MNNQKDYSRSPARSPVPRQRAADDGYRDYRDGRDGRGYGDSSYRVGRDRRYYADDGPSGAAGNRRAANRTDTLHYDDSAAEQDDYDDRYDDRGRRRRRSPYSRSPDRFGRSVTPPPRHGPHHTLIMEGLPMDVKEDDILDGFDAFTNSPRFASDHIRSVRLRTNKMGRRICFVEFHRVSDAEDFAERCRFSMDLDLPGPGGTDMETVRVILNYSRARDEGGRGDNRSEGSWICASCNATNYSRRMACYKCGLENDENGVGAGPILTGETDEASPEAPSQYLVVRDLEPSVTEEVLAKGISKLYLDESRQPTKEEAPPAKKLKSTAPVGNTANLGAKPGSLRRVFLMRDRRSNDSWRYGFAEFSTLEDAQGAVAKFRASPKFTIASKPVTVGYIHTGVFVPVQEADTHKQTNPPTAFVPVYNRDVLLKYWDARAYPSIHDVNVESSAGPPSAEDVEKPPSPEKGPAKEPSGSAGQDPSGRKIKKPKDKSIAMVPQMQMWTKKSAELHRERPEKGETAENGGDDDGTADPAVPGGRRRAFGPRAAHRKDAYTSYGVVDEPACLLCMRKFETAQDLRDHEVLSAEHEAALQDESGRERAVTRLERLGRKPETLVRRKPRDRSDKAPVYVSYADADGLCCLVCQRRFRSLAALRLHERESEMHRVSVADSGKVEQAVAQLLKLGRVPIKLRPVRGGGESSQQYRDRAKERRRAFNQPVKPTSKAGGDGAASKKEAAGGKRDGSAAPASGPAAPSKGAALLSKMGWTAGQGLGADGTGRAEAIQTEMYVPGVGLGAEGGKVGDAATEASRKTTGDYYSNFVQQTKDKARERFERLS